MRSIYQVVGLLLLIVLVILCGVGRVAVVGIWPNIVAELLGLVAALILVEVMILRKERDRDEARARRFISEPLSRAMTLHFKMQPLLRMADPELMIEIGGRDAVNADCARRLRDAVFVFAGRMPAGQVGVLLQVATQLDRLSTAATRDYDPTLMRAEVRSVLGFLERAFNVICKEPKSRAALVAYREEFKAGVRREESPEMAAQLIAKFFPDDAHARWLR